MSFYELHCGDFLAVAPELPAASFDGCLTDPPYGLAFMGKAWDHGVPGPEYWREVLRLLKPGASVLAFGGTRTFHRLTCAIEDAGFEIRDCLSWLYGQGFPKSMDVSAAIDKAAGAERERIRGVRSGVVGSAYARDPWSLEFKDSVLSKEAITDGGKRWNGWGTALKPAWEPVILAMKPTVGSFAENARAYGVAGLNIDGGRIGDTVETWPVSRRHHGGTFGQCRGWSGETQQTGDAPRGRFPANVLLDAEAAAELDRQSGESVSRIGKPRAGANGDGWGMTKTGREHADAGGASRFFYVAKASSSERDEGLGELPLSTANPYAQHRGRRMPDGSERIDGRPARQGKNIHPTVKPLDLCRYLATLILPPPRGDGEEPRRLLVPFSGSGSEMIGAYRAGWDRVVGVEREAEYVAIAERRLAAEVDKSGLFVGGA